MNRIAARLTATAALGACLAAWPAAAGTLTFDLTDPGALECGSTWTETGATFEITRIPANHSCTGSCFPGSDNKLLWLYPAGLQMSFDAIQGVVDVEIDLSEQDPSLTATAWLFELGTENATDTAVSSTTGPQMLTLNAQAAQTDRVLIVCCECSVTQIRLIGPTIVETTARSWSAIKGLYSQ